MRTLRQRILALLWVNLHCLWSSPLSPAALADPRLTGDQAIQIATAFCQQVGQPVTGYSNDIVFDRTLDASAPLITESDAIARAAVVEATGHPMNELSFWQVEFHDAYHTCSVLWRRAFQGIPYLDQHVPVDIRADTGELEGLSIVFASPPATFAVFNVSQDQAANTAAATVANAGIGDAIIWTEEAEVVRPSTYWQNGNTHPLPVTPRTAWHCNFAGYHNSPQVYVDAETGAVIGGENGFPVGLSVPSPGPYLRRPLEKAREVRLYGRDRKFQWGKTPLSILKLPSHPQDFQSLRKAISQPGAKPVAAEGYKLPLFSGGKRPDILFYVPKKGLLGGPGEWYAAPAAFVSWVKSVTPKGGTKK